MSVLAVKLRRDVRRQWPQFTAIAVTIFLGVALFGASYDAYRNLDASYRQAFVEYRFANLTVTDGSTSRIAAAMRGAQGVDGVQTRSQADLPLRVSNTELLGRAIGIPSDRRPSVNRLELQSGTRPDRSREALVEQHMAEEFDLEPGDALVARGQEGPLRLRVSGIAASPEYFWPARSRQDLLPGPRDFGVIFAPEPTVQRLRGARDPNQALAYYAGGEPDEALTERLGERAMSLGAAGILDRSEQPSNSALQQDVKSFEELAILFPLLFLTAAALATGVLMRRMVTAERPIVGMLRAAGYSRGQVVRHYLGFGLGAGLLGGVFGAGVGFALAGAVTDLYVTELSIPVTKVELRPLTPLVGVAFGFATGLLAAGLPARSAASTPPAEAMRRFAPSGGGKLSLAERIAPPLRRLPVRWRMALRSLGRNRSRTASTALGVVLALTLILVSWGMVDTAQILVDRQFTEVQRQDAQLFVDRPLDASTLERVREAPGVARAEPAVEIPVSLSANGRSYQTALVGLREGTRMHGFLTPEGSRTELPTAALLAGEALRGELGIEAGDAVSARVPEVGQSARVPVRGFVSEPLGTYAYASLGSIRVLAGERVGLGNAILVRYRSGVDRERMRERLSAVSGVVAFEDTQALRRAVDQYLGLFYAFVGVMLLFGGAMAFALMFNAISSSIAERSVEVATLRAAGMPFRQMARMITTENVLVTLIGIGPGLIAGYLVADAFMGSFSSDQFSFDLEMRTSTLVLSSVAIVVVALLSQIPGLRAVRRLDVAEVVRERAA